MRELLPEILAFILAGIVFGIPVFALSLRFALKPLVEAYARVRETQQADPKEVSALRRELAVLDQRLDSMETQLHRLDDAAEFKRQLKSPQAL